MEIGSPEWWAYYIRTMRRRKRRPSDSLAPTVTAPTIETVEAQPALAGTVSEPASVTVTVSGVQYHAVVSGAVWSIAAGVIAPLSAGSTSVSVSATDAAGNVGTSTGAVTRYTLPPLTAHYDAAALSNADGASLASWADTSGNGYTLTQATSGLRPKKLTDSAGRKFVRFTQNWMSNASAPLNTRNASVFAVLRHSTNGAAGSFVSWVGYSAGVLRVAGNSASFPLRHYVGAVDTGIIDQAANLRMIGGALGTTVTALASGQTVSGLTPLASGSIAGINVGSLNGASMANFDLYELIVAPASASAQQIADYLRVKYGLPAIIDRRIALEGDSNFAGYGDALSASVPHELAKLFDSAGRRVSVGGYATGGAFVSPATNSISNNNGADGQGLDAAQLAGVPSDLVVHVGRNDVAGGVTPAAAYAALVAWVRARVASGWRRVYVCTYVAQANATVQANVATLNSLIRGAAAGGSGAGIVADAGAYAVIDVAADPRFATSAAAGNLALYQADGIHINGSGGTAAMAELIYAAVVRD